jgi:hypothetical protein
MTQGGYDPTLGYLHAYLDFSFVPRAIGSRRHNAHVIVRSHLLIRRVEIRIVAAGPAHTGPGVIGHQ